jgi:hypothetical protein
LQRRRLHLALALPDAVAKPEAAPTEGPRPPAGHHHATTVAAAASGGGVLGPFPAGTRQRALEANRAKLLTWHTGKLENLENTSSSTPPREPLRDPESP